MAERAPSSHARSEPLQRHGGKVLVDQLALNGVDTVFSIPGESFLAVLDGLYAGEIRNVVCRQEGGAAMMAEAWGKVTGRPGIAFVTRGPGATNASAGVHVAFQDSTPMILFIGQVAADQRDREAFQEVDYRAMYGPLAKWVAQIDQPERIPEYVSRAFHTAVSGRPGPVVLALPEDMLAAAVDVADALPPTAIHHGPSDADVAEVVRAIASAEKPFVIVGGGGWDGRCADHLAQFAEAFDLPVGASFRCQDYLDNHHPSYAGDVGIGINPALAARVREADLILAIGARLGEITTSGYTLLTPPLPQQRLVHVHPDPNELGKVYRPQIGIASASAPFVAALAGASPPRRYSAWRAAARADYEAWQVPQETPGAVKMEGVVAHLSEVLSKTAVLTNGAGNYSAWLHRYFRYRAGAGVWRTQVAPTSGSMGYGLPAAIAAKLADPSREVIAFAGDGCFQMTGMEFGTACEAGANVIVLVCNNGSYGTIRMHQERAYPGRPSGTAMLNPDFAAWAKSYGAHGETVTRTEDFPAAFERARAAGSPAIIDLKTDPRALSPRLTLADA